MNSIKVTMILTGSEAGRRCVSSEAEIGVVGVRRVSGTRGARLAAWVDDVQEESMGPNNPAGR